MLGASPYYISLGATQENPRSQAYCQIIGIIKQGAESAGCCVVSVICLRSQYTHIRIDNVIAHINGAIIVLIGISGINQHSIGQIFESYLFSDSTPPAFRNAPYLEQGVGSVRLTHSRFRKPWKGILDFMSFFG